jgi:chitinase
VDRIIKVSCTCFGSSTRKNFCSKAKALITQYKFDGIDIDWEHPGFTEHNGTPADAQNTMSQFDERYYGIRNRHNRFS